MTISTTAGHPLNGHRGAFVGRRTSKLLIVVSYRYCIRVVNLLYFYNIVQYINVIAPISMLKPFIINKKKSNNNSCLAFIAHLEPSRDPFRVIAVLYLIVFRAHFRKCTLQRKSVRSCGLSISSVFPVIAGLHTLQINKHFDIFGFFSSVLVRYSPFSICRDRVYYY